MQLMWICMAMLICLPMNLMDAFHTAIKCPHPELLVRYNNAARIELQLIIMVWDAILRTFTLE